MPSLADQGAHFDSGITIGPNGPMVSPGDILGVGIPNRAPGIDIPHRGICSSTAGLTNQRAQYTYFTAPITKLITSMEYCSGGTAAGATPTLVRYGIYTVNDDLSLTLSASTTNDTAIFVGTDTAYPKAITSPSAGFTIVAGQRYAHALLLVSGAAMPTIVAPLSPKAAILNQLPYLARQQTGLSDLPATVTLAAQGAGSFNLYCYLS